MNTNTTSRISQLPTAAAEAGDAIAQEATRFGELARAWWTRNANTVRDAAGTMRDGAAAMGSRTRLYVKDEPVKSILMATAFGALLAGLLLWLFRSES